MNEIIYTSRPQLASPRIFFRELLRDLQATKELGWISFVNNFRSQYRQNWLGYIWLLIPPFMTALIWIYLSHFRVINTNTNDNVYPLYVLTGVFIWQTFVEAINCPLQQLNLHRHILTKIKVPHEAFIVAGLGAITFNLLIRIGLVAAAFILFGFSLKWTIFFAPFGLFSVIVFGLAIGMLAAPIGMLYRDVSSGLNVFTSLWFFITPVIYSVPETENWKLINFNPVTPLLTTTRDWIINETIIPKEGFYIVFVLAVCGFLAGWVLYRLAKPHLIARM